MTDRILDLLTAIELREAELLSWGAVDAHWTEHELLELLKEHNGPPDALSQLLASALLVRTPDGGGYRSRSAETIRLLATLRQSFPGRRVTEGNALVLDYRFLHRPRRRPSRNLPGSRLVDEIGAILGRDGRIAASALTPDTISGFQQRAAVALLEALRADQSTGVMVSAGTGSGKTLAFYLPLLSWLAGRVSAGTRRGTLCLALYPRNELLKDQLRALVGFVQRIRAAGGPTISLATWFGATPRNAHYVRQGWAEDWKLKGRDYVCPFLRCVQCDDGDLVWRIADLNARPVRERLECANCRAEVDGRTLRLTRESARGNPADVMLTTTESLNRQLAAPGNLRAFGVQPATLSAVLLDEVHTYEGTTGAQNALLLRRLTHRIGRRLVWAGLSATLRQAPEFFGQLVGLPPSRITLVEPRAEELEYTGAEYQLALRHSPYSRAGTLSTSIQACMALARCLDASVSDPFALPPSSENVFGTRLFAFTDKLDSTNRLYWDLLDAEGFYSQRTRLRRRVLTLAHMRSRDQARLAPDVREQADARDPDGQWWWLPELLGHGLGADRQLDVGRTSSQDRGVAADAQVVVATATLEVGFDDDRVGAVLQHKAPHDPAQFLQRKGRAGRQMITRPWTVVVLSDWGRDRAAWDSYESLFDPELPARNIPLKNLYVLRIQAVYALMDWLAIDLDYGDEDSVWADLSGPAEVLHPAPDRQAVIRRQQDHLADLLGRVLRPGPERERLRRHLIKALDLGRDEWAEFTVDSLLWDAPRPLMLAVVPTIRRQLLDQWRGEEPAADDRGVMSRTPLRQFVPGNLFDDLIVPDVEFVVPSDGDRTTVEHLPALRALSEFCPGNVTRHFGIWAANKRHWLPLPESSPGDQELKVDLVDVYRATVVDTVDTLDGRVTVYTPLSATLVPVPRDVRDASTVRPEWEFDANALGRGTTIQLPRVAARLVDELRFHLHAQGGGVRTIRYARSARGVTWRPGSQPVRLRYGVGTDDGWSPAAAGVDMYGDGVQGLIVVPDHLGPPTPVERVQRLQHLLIYASDLPDEMSDLDRTALADVVVLAVAEAALRGSDTESGPNLTARLREAEAVLGNRRDNGKDADSEGSADGHDGDEATEEPDSWLDDPVVVAAVDAARHEILADDRTADWVTWWRRRYVLTVAYVVLAALAELCPGVNADEILVDLDPDQNGMFWLSERSPGGTGQIEAFHRVLAADPEAITRALEDAMRPTAAETVDAELSALLLADAPEVAGALDALRSAWRGGHAAVTDALEVVDRVLVDRDLGLGSPARSALAVRLAGPGAHPNLLDELRSWLELRATATERSRLHVDGRTLGGLLADDASVDVVLHLAGVVDSRRRARAVANVLWPSGVSSQTDLGFNPFAPVLRGDLAAVRAHVDLAPASVELTGWGADARAAVHQALQDHGHIALVARAVHRPLLRAAVLDLQVTPVEVGSMLCHPLVVGLRSDPTSVEVRLLLREAL